MKYLVWIHEPWEGYFCTEFDTMTEAADYLHRKGFPYGFITSDAYTDEQILEEKANEALAAREK